MQSVIQPTPQRFLDDILDWLDEARSLDPIRARVENGLAYFILGRCHNPAIRAGRPADPADTTPLTFRGLVGIGRLHYVAAQRYRLGSSRLMTFGRRLLN